MSQRDGQALGGSGSPTRPAADSPIADAPPSTVATTTRNDVFSALSSEHQQPMIAVNGPIPSPRPVVDSARQLLQDAIAGRLSPLPLADDVEVQDAGLDECQRDAVARAIATPDIFVVQGPAGTGKSRVANEIIRQVAQSGGRVLLLSPEPATVDSMLSGLAKDLAVERRLAPGESSERLPPAIAAMTYSRRRDAARASLIQRANDSLASAEQRAGAAEAVLPLWNELVALRERRSVRDTELRTLAARRNDLADEVRREAESASDPTPFYVQRLRNAATSHGRRLSTLDAQDSDLRTVRTEADSRRRTAEMACQELRPRADALQNRRWFTLTYWQARSDGTLAKRLESAQADLASATTALAEIAVREQKLNADRKLAEQEHRTETDRWIEGEVTRRKAELDARDGELDREGSLDGKRDAELSARIGPLTADPETGRQLAETELAEARRELASAIAWKQQVAEHIDDLVAEATADVQIVAGPIAGVATDSTTTTGAFELLLIEDAHRLSEADFLSAARLASKCVLIGETCELPAGRGRSTRPDLFARLTAGLTHSVWVQDESHLVCHLHPVRGAERKRLECEPVADSPEIELRVYAPLNAEPLLAEVAFPAGTEPAAAREFLFREMGEVTCQPALRNARWEQPDSGVVLRFGTCNSSTSHARIGEGVREELDGLMTRAIHFDSSWSQERAREWASEHVGIREPGRLVSLVKPYRACPGLADWLNRAFHVGFSVPSIAEPGRHVEFLAVPDLDPRRRRETNGRPSRVGGAGYEIDLSDSRQRSALPADLTDLPGMGFVNLPEAQAIVRYLEPLAGPAIAVTSPFPAQVAVLRKLFARSARLSNVRVLDPGDGTRQECELLAVSLTRSHVARAVTFGETPAVLAGLLARARKKVLFAGDPGTLARRLQWDGPVDHLDAAEAARERGWVAALADCPRVSTPRPRGDVVRA